MSESDATGALAQTHYQDAFGNTQASWITGLWGGDKDGWHLDSKQYDNGIGIFYMDQRWYDSALGGFLSRSIMPQKVEHPYTFVASNPVTAIDPNGEFIWFIIIPAAYVIGDVLPDGHFDLPDLPTKVKDGATSASDCESARDNYNRWLNDPKLQQHPRYWEILQKVREEYNQACGIDAPCKLYKAGEAVRDTMGIFEGASGEGESPTAPPIFGPPTKPHPHLGPFEPIPAPVGLP